MSGLEETLRTKLETRVEFIRWPVESRRRERCRTEGIMRILVLEAGVAAPVCADIREDWVRAPISKGDLKARADALRMRSSADFVPRMDSSGVLRFRSMSVVLSPTEADLVSRLAESFAEGVDRDVLLSLLPGGTKANRNALDLHVMRIRRRIAPLGLCVRTIWGRGYALDVDEDAER